MYQGGRAMQFSILSSPPWAFNPFPPGGGRGAVKLAPLRRRRRGERGQEAPAPTPSRQGRDGGEKQGEGKVGSSWPCNAVLSPHDVCLRRFGLRDKRL